MGKLACLAQHWTRVAAERELRNDQSVPMFTYGETLAAHDWKSVAPRHSGVGSTWDL